MSQLQVAKAAVMLVAGLEKDALHIYVALTVFLLSSLIFRWPVRSLKPLILVALAALAGEIWDWRDSVGRGEPIALAAHWHDIWNTLFWPSVLVLLARTTRVFSR